MYFTYILRSLKTGKHYYGSCEDLEKLLILHNAGKIINSRKYFIHSNVKYNKHSLPHHLFFAN